MIGLLASLDELSNINNSPLLELEGKLKDAVGMFGSVG
jgi:hypothetical protein